MFLGTLQRPFKIVKESPAYVLKGTVVSATASFEPIYAKFLVPTATSIELVCGWLARAVGLPVPHSGLVVADKSRMPRDLRWPYSTDTQSVFASAEVYGALRLDSFSSPVIRERLGSWKFLELAGAFDELIANDDRSLANALIDSKGEFWLIDHARALGGCDQKLFSSNFFPSFRNFFLDCIKCEPLSSRLQRKQILLEACAQLRYHSLRIPYSELRVSSELESEIRRYLETRCRVVQDLVLNRVEMADLLTDVDRHIPH